MWLKVMASTPISSREVALTAPTDPAAMRAAALAMAWMGVSV